GLDRLQPRGREPVDELDLGGGGHDRLLVLQPVARAHLDDPDGRGQRAHASAAGPGSSTASTASASTNSPSAARISAMVPARGARSASSIFIASITSTSWPSSTLSPAADRTR